MPRQILTIELDGLTAADYLCHFSDPEPSALGHGLHSVAVRAEPLGTTVEVLLDWEAAAPEPCAAAQAAGLPQLAEAISLESRVIGEPPVRLLRAA